jgi:S-adenosylmethionine:tRNA ribosyltransferase-isomerase
VLVSRFDFDLPEDRIALRPVTPRDSARLLVANPNQQLIDAIMTDLPEHLRAGDIMVLNNTKVLPTQLFGWRGNAKIGVTLVKRAAEGLWWGFARNAKRLKNADRIDFNNQLNAVVVDKQSDGQILLQFENYALPFEHALLEHGMMPLPPYISGRRPADAQDIEDYQTVFAKHDGSVAAPTASLHFTTSLMERLREIGVEIVEVTLHVGAGTFLPVKVDDTDDHIMHPEWGTVTKAVAGKLNAIRSSGGRILCCGTTALRLIESSADEHGIVHEFAGETGIFIMPGYRFRVADMLLTNFHLPRSTLLMLVSAFCGLGRMQQIYSHAIAQDYRFYSYGDASLLMRHD